MGAEELHRILTRLVEGFNDSTGRVEILEREMKMVGDALGTVGRHCQTSATELRGHLASSNADLGKAMQALDAALRVTIEAAQERFAEFQRDSKELLTRTDQGVTQLNFKTLEHERVMTDMNNKINIMEVKLQQQVPMTNPMASSGAADAPPQPAYHNMSTPAKETMGPQTSAAAASTDSQQGYAWAGWQQGGQHWAPPHAPADGFDPWRRGPTTPNPGGPANPWPQPAGEWPVLRHGSAANAKFFDSRFGQDPRNQYDGWD